MDTIKIILIAIGLLTVVVAGYFLVGIVFSLLWFLLWVGIVGALGYGGYKLFFDKEKPRAARLEEKTPVAIADLKDVDRALEEYKRKSLKE